MSHQGWLVQRIALALFCVLIGGQAFAADDAPKVIAVQNRTYYLSDEITFQVGYLPLDSFTKYWALGGTYTHFYSDFLGWEVVDAQYAAANDSGLTNELVTRFEATAIKGDILNYYATTNIVYTPMYTKNLLFNKSIISGETSFVLGGGISKFDSGNINTIDFGIIFRFVMGKSSGIKVDFRNYIYLSGDTKNNLAINLGYAYTFGSIEKTGPVKESDD